MAGITSKLWRPLKIGHVQLGHRVAMPALSRHRADNESRVQDIVKEYFAQRSSSGGLLISDATQISPGAGGAAHAPGIWNDEQIAAWKNVTDAVHARGAKMFCQLWHTGRTGDAERLRFHGRKLMSSSAVPLDLTDHSAQPVPEEMTERDIWNTVSEYAVAAHNAVFKAGFDGVEIHGGNGYLPDQFLQDTCNNRTDGWGGSIPKRARFHLEVTKAVANEVGANRTAVRLTPHGVFHSMGMADAVPQFAYLVGELRHLGLAYLSLVEPRGTGLNATDKRRWAPNGVLVEIWQNTSPVILAGGFTQDSAQEAVDTVYKDYDVVIAFGRHFISTPDLAFRFRNGLEFNPYDRTTFYKPPTEKGYLDYNYSVAYRAEMSKGNVEGVKPFLPNASSVA
ncbi:hypothetical protein QBC47DRAFT_426600 [Echria macrotheca]|uniref:NADH:flavin oxidoreductase/NADH oxidase N-terminal domain-containing protein n=1 Tax=Echria macrotheca TaxID=438768 RepID=A0AAJ0B427_9PEZI|nr:hypothetical protein QBC47DRAFT_426600 [Echria macrotheca]